jgi:glutamine synthetase
MTKVLVEYIWLGGENELRSKTRVLTMNNITQNEQVKLYDIPDWDYDGSSTKQADGANSEVILKPCAIYKDPFRKDSENMYKSYLVLCATYRNDGTPLSNNYRDNAVIIFDKKRDEVPWFGLEQEYFLFDNVTQQPVGFVANEHNITKDLQGQYYCSVGSRNAFCRNITEEHMMACIYAGINISGINAEVAPGQWEYQIGPCTGISAADQLWTARYILERITEKYGVYVVLDPKPFTFLNGSGCHTNFSTKSMRNKNGLEEIYNAIELLKTKHEEHMKVYGEGNEMRLTGKHETSGFHKFTYGQADRGASIRIGNKTMNDSCGYFEDRRPSSNMNPYLVTSKIFETIMQKIE